MRARIKENMKHSTDPAKFRNIGIAALIFFGCLLGVSIWKHMPIMTGVFGILYGLGLGFILMAKSQEPVKTDPEKVHKFGKIALIFFGCLLGLVIWKDRPIMTGVFGALCGLGLGFIIMPKFLGPVQSAWVATAMFIAKTINTIFLTIAWYGVITPFAFGKRLISGVPLSLAPDKDAKTYWIDRKEPAQPRKKFSKRY